MKKRHREAGSASIKMYEKRRCHPILESCKNPIAPASSTSSSHIDATQEESLIRGDISLSTRTTSTIVVDSKFHKHHHHHHHDNKHLRAITKSTKMFRPLATCCSTLLLLLFLQLISQAIGQQYQRSQGSSPSLSQPQNLVNMQQQQQQQTFQLPQTWAGRWYQANKEPIRITNTEISDKGVCRDKKGDKYLFEYTNTRHIAHALAHNNPQAQQQQQQQQASSCLICLVINERHLNVLQYKESSCQPIPVQYLNKTSQNALVNDNDHSLLDSICSDITGDAQLESLFRLQTPAIECPINGKYQFSYDNCRDSQSTLDSCIDKKQLNFKFSACSDMPGSEPKSEVLKCYADWSEGNNYYMIGRLESASNAQDKGKFRCFLYEKSADGEYIQMAQSLEESCYGLINANEGPKTLRLKARQPTSNKCHLPSYIQSQSENWLSVDNSLIYKFNQNSTKYEVKETKEGNVIEEATCLQQLTYPAAQVHPHLFPTVRGSSSIPQQQVTTTPTSRRYLPSSNHFNQIDQSLQQTTAASSSRFNDVVYLVQITKNCQTTDYCVRFYRRASGIVQIDYFKASPGKDGHMRCQSALLDTPQTQIITSTNLEPHRCPFDGAFTIEAPQESEYSYNPSNIFICPRQSYLTAQCEHPSHLKIHYKCSAKFMLKNLYCLGSWTTQGLVRMILADDDRQRYSAWYRDYGLLYGSNVGAATDAGDLDSSASGQLQTTTAASLTRSQELLALSPAASNSLASSVIDLQITLITAPPAVSKPMQVRLKRRMSCSELPGYAARGSMSPYHSPSHSVSSYDSFSATSGALTSTSVTMIGFSSAYITWILTISISSMLYTLANRRILV